jgi:transcriptional regulator with XRE-family HTH domain
MGSLRPKSKHDLWLGAILALLRVARGMRKEDLAKTLGIEQAHVASYERHDYTAYSLDNLDRG